jgi:hypothetical protein
VTVNGTAVSGAPFTVNSGDNTLYFESGSGAVSVTQAGQVSACDLNNDGAVNVIDLQISVSAALGITSCSAVYDLNQDGVCNVIDSQRVVDAALGLGCRIGP